MRAKIVKKNPSTAHRIGPRPFGTAIRLQKWSRVPARPPDLISRFPAQSSSKSKATELMQ